SASTLCDLIEYLIIQAALFHSRFEKFSNRICIEFFFSFHIIVVYFDFSSFVFFSPSNTALTSTEQVKAYLQTEGTCKCGLECPVNCDVTFNFSPKVSTRPWTAPVIGPGDLTKLCNHKRKLLTQPSTESVDSRYGDGIVRKKRKVCVPQPSVSQLLSQREQAAKEQLSFNGLPWRENSQQFAKTTLTNGYQEEYRYQDSNSVQYQRLHEGPRCPPQQIGMAPVVNDHLLQTAQSNSIQQVNFEQRLAYTQGIQTYEGKLNKSTRGDFSQLQEVINNVVPAGTQNLNVNRTPPWQQNKQQQNNVYERVPPLHPNSTVPAWNQDFKRKQHRIIKKRYSDDCPNGENRSSSEQPSFMEDPSGYLAQQTALLNSTISRQNANSPSVEGIPLASNINKSYSRPKSRNTVTSRFPDSSLERKKVEEPSSTLPEKQDDRGPIQGATVSTSNRSPPESTSPDTVTTIVTTMASGHTASSNTITSVLAGRANTATVTVNNQTAPPQKQNSVEQPSASPNSLMQNSIPQEVIKNSGHILVSSNGQLIVTNSMLSPQPAVQKINTTSPGTNQIGVTSQVLNHPTVLVNTLPGPLLLQPSVVVDGLNTMQIPQLVGNVAMQQNQVIEETNLLSPDSKRKAVYKKRKMSPTVGSMLLSPQGTNNVMVQQQQLNAPVLQAVTLVPSKTNFASTQQLIAANMLQPLNLVQNFPIQQFIVPAGVSGMVMSDGTILQDAVQLNLLTPVQNTGVYTSGQNLITPGMVIRTPSNQTANKVVPNNQFLSSSNQYLVNNTFSGQLSPMLSVSPNPCSRNQEFIPQNVVVQQPNTSNTTVVQQNTTIVQQTTMVSNQQTQPTPTLNLNHQNFILNEKPNFILTSEKQNFILSPNNDKILINSDNMRGNFVLGNIDKQNFVLNNVDKQNLIINNIDKGFIIDKKNSVSTQTQNQVLQISSTPALVVATNNTLCQKPAFSESPPDTTTLSPVDQEVTTSLQPTSPDEPSSQSLPMVHCISSSSQQAEGFLDNYNGGTGKIGNFAESTCIPVHSLQGKNNFNSKMSLLNVPDSVHIPNNENEMYLKESD
ncbi:uncharacterized protein LOC106664879, partial [Cimex lectularius]|uniref:Uncharacterized protein n=1 Tax=Cimex lectularius TaxID=79782 RepID=A0A8I6SLM0_CIMLE